MELGSGAFRYEWVGSWGRLPAGTEYGYTHGVVVDAQDRVYVHNRSKDAVIVFDRDGNFLSSWGESFRQGAHGLSYNREAEGEFLYFADPERHLVCKTTLDGDMLWWKGAPERPDIYGAPVEYQPTGVAVAPSGDFYVGDGYGKSWVHHYDKDARYIRSFGGPLGTDRGRLNCPHGLWVDTRRVAQGGEPELYVADRGNARLQVFTLDGQPKRIIADEMKQPCGFYQIAENLIVPDLQARVTILDKEDKPIVVLGDNPEAPTLTGWPNVPEHLRPRKFNSPHAACADSRGDLYVVEWISIGRVVKLLRK